MAAPNRSIFFPRANGAILSGKLAPTPIYPKILGPVYDRENVDKPILIWTVEGETANYPPVEEAYAPATIPDEPECLADRYLRPTLAKNERIRLSMLWYHTRDIFTETEFLSRLQEKVCIAQESSGWGVAVIGTLGINSYTRLASVGVPIASLPRGESLCAHTIIQPSGSVFLLPSLKKDWRFADSPYSEFAGFEAYAGVPLQLEDASGDTVYLGTLCVASSCPEAPLTRAQQMTMCRMADWIVSDIVQVTRARRQRERCRMVDLLAVAQAEMDAAYSEEPILRILRDIYPEAVVSVQSSKLGHIEVDGRDPIIPSDLSDGVWEDVDFLEEYIVRLNHQELPSDRVVRLIAASFHSVAGQSFLTVGTRDFRMIFDDIDAWFVQKCGSVVSQMWQKHLLEEAMVVKEKFLRGFSHQLRTPVHGILGAVDLLLEDLPPRNLDDTMTQAKDSTHSPLFARSVQDPRIYLETIKRSGRDLESIINSMIALNRWADVAISERELRTHTAYEIEKELTDGMLKLLSDDSRYNSSVIIKHSLPPDHCSIRTDIGLLRDCLVPLLLNAIQNTPTGTIVVTISVILDCNELVVDVQDTGCGIALGDQERIFELYEKRDVYSTGAGLGLTLASKFSALLDGSVELVSSEVNQGSHFRATFRGVDGVHSSSSLSAKPLVPPLAHIPRWYHILPSAGPSPSLSSHTADFLNACGLTPSTDSTQADTLVIFDFIVDPNLQRALVSLIPSNRVAICLVPSLHRGTQSNGTDNVVYVHGLFTTTTLSTALQQANMLMSLCKADRVDSVTEHMASLTFQGDATGTSPTAASATPQRLISPHPGTGTTMWPLSSGPLPTPPAEEFFVELGFDVNVPRIDTVSQVLQEFHNPHFHPKFPYHHTASHPTALLVDDNAVNLRVLQMYCTKRKLPFISARDGLEAVALFRSHQSRAASDLTLPIQLILMDLQMPVCDGIEATRQLRQLEEENGWPKSVLFVVTGQDSPADRKMVANVGGQEYYVKPVSLKTLDIGLKQYFSSFQGNQG